MKTLGEKVKAVLKDASSKLSGLKRRLFEAKTVEDLFDGNARQAERELGWSRHTIQKGQQELHLGIECVDGYVARGNHRTEAKLSSLEVDIRALVEPESQVDLETGFLYTRLTAKALREALILHKGYGQEELPTERTFVNILNRLGYRLRSVQKSKPVKKVKQVDEIFTNLHQANAEVDRNPKALRISIDTKAAVKIGPFSRDGRGRGCQANQACDHDLQAASHLIPFGILVVVSGLLTIVFGQSKETSDFIVDALTLWWEENRSRYSQIQELVINLDNGPQISGQRTQFLKRMIEFADTTGLKIRLLYYPPYHSKYNPIERCWSSLERHWNGTILDTMQTALRWAATMTWKALHPMIHFIQTVYEKGMRLTKKEMKQWEQRLNRSPTLPKWDISIEPQPG